MWLDELFYGNPYLTYELLQFKNTELKISERFMLFILPWEGGTTINKKPAAHTEPSAVWLNGLPLFAFDCQNDDQGTIETKLYRLSFIFHTNEVGPFL